MRRTTAAIGLAMAGLAASAAAPQSGAPKELLGEYRIVAGKEAGQELPRDRFEGSVVRFTADTIAMADKESKDLYVAKYTLDAARKPYKIAMTATGGPGVKPGEKASGLLEVDGDTVRICYAPEGEPVPTAMETKAGTKQLLFEMRRRQP